MLEFNQRRWNEELRWRADGGLYVVVVVVVVGMMQLVRQVRFGDGPFVTEEIESFDKTIGTRNPSHPSHTLSFKTDDRSNAD